MEVSVLQIPEGYMQDAKGSLIPIDMVKEIDKLRDSLVKEIAQKAAEMSSVLEGFKKKSMDDIEAFIDLSAEKYGVAMGGKKGNVTLTSFDGSLKLIRAMADKIVFDERLQVAKSLIDECIHEWTKETRSEIKTLIDTAFEVDKEGKINTGRVLGLRRLDITDPKWLKAMEAISDSITVASTQAYIRVYRRKDDGTYKLLNLDVAAL
jgi:hypothetical protein